MAGRRTRSPRTPPARACGTRLSGAEPTVRSRRGRVHARRPDGERARGGADRARGRASRHLHPHALPRLEARSLRRLPHVRRRRRGRAAADARLRDARHRGHGALDERPDHRLPADADRDAPLRAPERVARRPAERAPRPRERARRRGSADPPRRQARGVRRPQPAHGLRPGRVHPLQPLRPLHAGGHAVLGALARGPRRRRAHRPDLGPLLARHRVRALRRLSLRLPDRRDLREVRGGHEAARARARAGADDLHVLRRRLPDRPQPRPETKHIVKVTSKDEYLPNEGNLCVKGRFAFNFVHHPDRLTEPLVRGRGRRAARHHLGARDRDRRRRACAASSSATARRRSASSRRRA